MNSNKAHKSVVLIGLVILLSRIPVRLHGYEIFIYRPIKDKKPLLTQGRVSLHGELFGQLQLPSTFPSFNDLSGAEDRWNFGFRKMIYLTESTRLLAQLVAHDDTRNRTKFDWHFSLRQSLAENLVLIIGHDSNHDSDRQSLLNGKPFYTNRNYIGLGFPVEAEGFYIEPFTWFFHTSNQRVHLDLTGEKISQEIGLRLGVLFADASGIHIQVISQSDRLFTMGRALLADFILRLRLTDWLEIAAGAGFWKDVEFSPAANRKSFHKMIWGIAIPF